MIAKIKLIEYDKDARETIRGIYKMDLTWHFRLGDPQVGMTVIIPQEEGSFRFYISHLVADLRTQQLIIIDRKLHFEKQADELEELRQQLLLNGWEEEQGTVDLPNSVFRF